MEYFYFTKRETRYEILFRVTVNYSQNLVKAKTIVYIFEGLKGNNSLQSSLWLRILDDILASIEKCTTLLYHHFAD